MPHEKHIIIVVLITFVSEGRGVHNYFIALAFIFLYISIIPALGWMRWGDLKKKIFQALNLCIHCHGNSAMFSFVTSHCNLLVQLPLPLSGPDEVRLDHLRLSQLVQGYQQLHAAGLLVAALETQVTCLLQ